MSRLGITPAEYPNKQTKYTNEVPREDSYLPINTDSRARRLCAAPVDGAGKCWIFHRAISHAPSLTHAVSVFLPAAASGE